MIESQSPLPMITREIEPVEITTAEIAFAFCDADSEKQAEFLLLMAKQIAVWGPPRSWPMQCRHIVDEFDTQQRMVVASVLGTLMDHLQGQP